MTCAEECSPKNFGLNHPTPQLFVNSQWKIPQIVYLIYRVLVAVFFIVWVILSGAVEYSWYNTESNRVKWFIYLTNWMFLFLTVDTIVQVIVVCISYRKTKNGDSYHKGMPWYFKAMWVLYNIAIDIGIVVTLAFWILLYPAMGCHSNEVYTSCGSPATPTCSEPNPIAAELCVERCACTTDLPIWYDGSCITLSDCPNPNSTTFSTTQYELRHVYTLHYIDIITHGANSIYIIINFFITGIPIRVQHFWHSVVFGIIYVIFSLIYDVANGTNALGKSYIYSTIDWTTNPGSSAMYAIIVGLVAPILVWLILYALYWIRISIAKCCGCGHKYESVDFTAGEDVNLSEQGKKDFGSID